MHVLDEIRICVDPDTSSYIYVDEKFKFIPCILTFDSSLILLVGYYSFKLRYLNF